MNEGVGQFHWELSEPRLVTGYGGRRMLRAALTIACELADGRIWGQSTDGCLIHRNKTGKLEFRAARTRTRTGGFIAVSRITPDLVNAILEKVSASKYDLEIGASVLGDSAAIQLPETLGESTGGKEP